jgi:ribosome assembly protein YihI (activator of Der GTPase)
VFRGVVMIVDDRLDRMKAMLDKLGVDNEEEKGILYIPYLNYKGVFNIRSITPSKIKFDVKNKYHGDNVWILTAVDKEKNEFRDFSINDLIKGAIQHTLQEMHITTTPERLEGLFRKIEENFKGE